MFYCGLECIFALEICPSSFFFFFTDVHVFCYLPDLKANASAIQLDNEMEGVNSSLRSSTIVSGFTDK